VLLAALTAAGCSRTPAPDPRAAEGERPSPLQAIPPSTAGKRPDTPAPPPAPAENPRVTKTKEAGTVRGLVRWAGKDLPNPSSTTHRLRIGGEEVSVTPAPRLVIDPNSKGIADTAVWLEGLEGAASAGSEPLTLVRDRGRFRPAVQVAPRGSRLEVRTTEDRADFQASGAAAFSATLTRGQMRSFPLSRTGVVEVSSEEYPWMTPAYVVVAPGAGTVTAADGRFVLADVPAGSYHLVLWHPGWATEGAPVTMRIPVKLAAGEGISVEWDVSVP
jgi:hypothetical protein